MEGGEAASGVTILAEDGLRAPLLAAEHGPAADIESGLTSPAAVCSVEDTNETWLEPCLNYTRDLVGCILFVWVLFSDVLMLKVLYASGAQTAALLSTCFVVAPHAVLAVLLILRNDWIGNAAQCCSFITSLQPLDSMRPFPSIPIGFLVVFLAYAVYILIAASGLVFLVYCLVCYWATALLFSLVILDLSTIIYTVSPVKHMFKYSDMVYLENYKCTRHMLQMLLESLPQAVLAVVLAVRQMLGGDSMEALPWAVVLQVFFVSCINVVDKLLQLEAASHVLSELGPSSVLLFLRFKGATYVPAPVLAMHMDEATREAHGLTIACSVEDEPPPDPANDSSNSLVPEYLMPPEGGNLSPAQYLAVLRAVMRRFGGPDTRRLDLALPRQAHADMVLRVVLPCLPSVEAASLAGGRLCTRSSVALAGCLRQHASLSTLQLTGTELSLAGARVLVDLLRSNVPLTSLALARVNLPAAGAVVLFDALQHNSTLTSLALTYVPVDDASLAHLVSALHLNKTLAHVSLLGATPGMGVAQAACAALSGNACLRRLELCFDNVGPQGAALVVEALLDKLNPPGPFSLSCGATAGSFPVAGCPNVVFVGSSASQVEAPWSGEHPPGADPWQPVLYLICNNSLISAMAAAPFFFPGLQAVSLASMRAGDAGALEFAGAVRSSQQLTSLDLSGNDLGDEGVRHVTGAMQLLPALRTLNLSANRFGDTGLFELGMAAAVHPALSRVLLYDNHYPFSQHSLADLLALPGLGGRRGQAVQFGVVRTPSASAVVAGMHSVIETAAAGVSHVVATTLPGVREVGLVPLVLAKRAAAVAHGDEEGSDGEGEAGSVASDHSACGVCWDCTDHIAIRGCGHHLCVRCFQELCKQTPVRPVCPFCRAAIVGYNYLNWPLAKSADCCVQLPPISQLS